MKKATKKAEKKIPSRLTTRQLIEISPCQFSFADGRHCRMPRWDKHRSLCLSHARQQEQLLSVDQVGQELVSLSGDFKTSTDINHVLGKLFSLLAKNRIPRRNAAALAYIAQLLLQTLPAVETEIKKGAGYDEWEATVRAALGNPEPAASDDYDDDGESDEDPSDDTDDDSDEAENDTDDLADDNGDADTDADTDENADDGADGQEDDSTDSADNPSR